MAVAYFELRDGGIHPFVPSKVNAKQPKPQLYVVPPCGEVSYGWLVEIPRHKVYDGEREQFWMVDSTELYFCARGGVQAWR